MTSYGVVILLSAFLLFQIQPAIAKAILPWFGGVAAVWTTCLLFFQTLLVAGYGYADVLTMRLRPRAQIAVHSGLVGAAAIFALPLAVDPSRKLLPAADPTFEILRLLSVTVGLPYFVLSSTSPLVQAWAARAKPTRSPYPLYALSNLGSMLGLLTYPFLVEPYLTTLEQLRSWSVGFAVFVLATLAVAVRTGAARLAEPTPRGDPPAASTPGLVRFLWFALPACGSIVLLAVTNRMCREIAVVPFLWVLPLSIYLATFILCFASDRWYRRGLFLPALLLASLPVAFGFVSENLNLKLILGFHATLLFVACMVCHGELARLRPDPARLTSFYLASSLGGAAGGIFVAVGAPRIFDLYLELQLGILLALLLPPVVMVLESPERFRKRRWLWFLWIQAVASVAALMWYDTRAYYGESRLLRRNFFGTLRIIDRDAPGGMRRILVHGATSHGLEFLDPARRRMPTSYYTEESGAGRLLTALGSDAPRRLGIMGLGVGTLATYARRGDEVWFYEINPLVLDVARAEFHYLGDTEGSVHVELGDARLVLEAGAPRGFDALFADAFSSDAVPMHLLTIEAFGLYFRHLKPDGVLAVNLSNRALDLRPVVATAAAELGKEVLFIWNPDDRKRGVYAALWALVSANHDLLNRLRSAAPPDKAPQLARILWTDDFSSLLPVLK